MNNICGGHAQQNCWASLGLFLVASLRGTLVLWVDGFGFRLDPLMKEIGIRIRDIPMRRPQTTKVPLAVICCLQSQPVVLKHLCF